MANDNLEDEMMEEDMAEGIEVPEEEMAESPVQEIVAEVETSLEGLEGMDRDELIDEAIATLEGMKGGGESALGGLGGEEDFELPEPEEDIMA